MINRIKKIFREYYNTQKKTVANTEELLWAHIYHDSIRGKKWLEDLPLNVGRWAGNYTFFYVLNRILNDYRPNNILEFGLGESSKFISVYIDNELLETSHDIIEQSQDWANAFKERFLISQKSSIFICPLVEKEINGHKVNSYAGIDSKVNKLYDLYVVDGPFGSSHFSRYDIVDLVAKFPKEHEFIILMDDYQREGERETAEMIVDLLKQKEITHYTQKYTGNKSLLLIVSEKYKYLKSL